MIDAITYALIKRQIKSAMSESGSAGGASAFDIAVQAGFTGTEKEWLESLQGKPGYTPYIGDNGNWFVNEIDTGVCADSSKSIIPLETIKSLFIELEGGKL